MEQYLEIIEFIKAHRAIGSDIPKILLVVQEEFGELENIELGGSDNILDIVYKQIGERLVMATSIFIEN